MVDYNGNIDARLTEVSQKGATDRAEKGIPLPGCERGAYFQR